MEEAIFRCRAELDTEAVRHFEFLTQVAHPSNSSGYTEKGVLSAIRIHKEKQDSLLRDLEKRRQVMRNYTTFVRSVRGVYGNVEGKQEPPRLIEEKYERLHWDADWVDPYRNFADTDTHTKHTKHRKHTHTDGGCTCLLYSHAVECHDFGGTDTHTDTHTHTSVVLACRRMP